jgi:single-strand DNA-binding protein
LVSSHNQQPKTFKSKKQHQLNDTKKESKMANLNRVLLIGNCTRDPDQRFTPKGTAVTEIGLAINRIFKGENDEKKEEVTFVDVTLWGRQAEIAAQYLKKGKPVFIEGRLQLDSWDDKQTGQKRSRLRVVAESIQLLGSRQEGESSSPTPSPALAEQRARQTAPAPQGRTSQPDPDLDAEPDDIPF